MQYWVVNSCVEKPSKVMPTSTVWHIEFVNIQTKEHKVTYIEKRFKNYKNWRKLINSYPLGMIVTNLELYNGKRIDADSKPEILFAVSQSELADILAEHWNDY